MDIYNGTFIGISRADEQSTQNVIDNILSVGINPNLIKRPNNELLIEVPGSGINCPLNTIKASVSPACVRVFDSYVTDIGTEERIYYSV